jgi:integrase
VAPDHIPRHAPVRGGLAGLVRRRPHRRHRHGPVRSDEESDWDGPKSNTSERNVVLDSGTFHVLKQHRMTQNEARSLWGAGWTETGLVFTHEDGRALTPNGVSQRVDRLHKRHDLPPIRLHDLRRGSATLALTAGADIKVVSEQLGHSTMQITRDIYMSVMPQVAQAAADAAAALVPRAAKKSGSADSVPTVCPPEDNSNTKDDLQTGRPQVRRGGPERVGRLGLEPRTQGL